MRSPSPPVVSTQPSEWAYVNEGGATIVFSYAGDDPQFQGTVLRLRKTRSRHRAPGYKPKVPVSESEDSEDEEEPDDGMIAFQETVMERIIPIENLPRLESVHVTKPWLEAIAVLRDAERPLERRRKDHIDVTRQKAVLATDLVGRQGLVMEIKPKWGFMPSPAHLSTASSEVKLKTCRFCMHSRLRSLKGDKASLEYCPLDLFSADETRITKAVDGLFASCIGSGGEVNNLRVFVDGTMLKPTDDSSTLQLSSLQASLTKSLVSILLDTRLLSIISSLERSLDALDIEGVAELWHVAQPSHISLTPPVGFGEPAPTISEWSSFIDTFLAPPATPTTSTPHIPGNNTKDDHANPGPDSLRYYLLAYLLSATLKDCSIIIRPGDEERQIEPRVTVIDLDPKGMERLQKWEALDTEIWEAYLEAPVDERKTCIDANRG